MWHPAALFRGIRNPDPIPVMRAIAAALVSIGMAALARTALEQIVPGLLPFVFTFPAVIAAVLFGGERAGWIALVGCQALSLSFVIPHWIRDSGDRPQDAVNLLLSTFSLALVVWGAGAYRAAERGLRRQCEHEVRTLSLLANEVDHRTKNNFQIAAAMLSAQGRSAEPPVRAELDAAARRLVSIAAIYGSLSARHPDAGDVALLGHIRQIVEGARAGLLPPGVELRVTGNEVTVSATTALTVGLVVNEWITNAIKYAFPASGGTITISVSEGAAAIAVEVRDDGMGMMPGGSKGQGSRLLSSLVEVIDGRLEQRVDHGTVCTLTIPRSAGG